MGHFFQQKFIKVLESSREGFVRSLMSLQQIVNDHVKFLDKIVKAAKEAQMMMKYNVILIFKSFFF